MAKQLAQESKRLAALRDEQAECIARMEALLDEAGDKDLSAEQQAEYDGLETERVALGKRVEREEKFLEAKSTGGTVIRSLAGDGSDSGDGPRKPHIGKVTDAAAEDPRKGFKTPREYLMCVMAAGLGRRADARLKPLYVEASAGSDEQQSQGESYGGYLVPEGLLPGLMMTQPDDDPIAGRTTDVPMTAPVIKVNARTDKNHSTSVSGGLTVTRREETGGLSASRMQTEMIRLEAAGLFGLSYASEEILVDSPISFVALLQQGFQSEFGAHMVDERLNGTGVGQYLGIMNCPALISVAKKSGQATNTIVVDNILNMRSRCWKYSNAVWLANHDTLPQLSSLALAAGSSVVLVFMPSIREDTPDLLLGRPIIFTEFCQTLGSQGDLVLANWSQYLEGTYQPLQSAESMHVRFINHERTFKFWTRNAGAPWWRTALTPKNSTNTLSPFVTLDQRP